MGINLGGVNIATVNFGRLADALGLNLSQTRQLVEFAAQRGMSIFDAAQVRNVDLSNVDGVEFAQAYNNLSDAARDIVLPPESSPNLPAAIREAVQQLATAPPPAPNPGSPTPIATAPPTPGALPGSPPVTTPGNPTMAQPAPATPASAAPPGINTTHTGPGPQLLPHGPASPGDLVRNLLSPVLSPTQAAQPARPTGTVLPNNVIDRVFGGDGSRPGAATQQGMSTPATPTTTPTTQTTTADAVRDPNAALQVRGDGNQRNGVLSLLQTLVQGRTEGSNHAPQSAAQHAVQGRTEGGGQHAANNTGAMPTPVRNAVASVMQQTAQAFTGGQPQALAQVTDRTALESPLPQSTRGEAGGGGFRTPEGTVVASAAADRNITAQQQMQAQQTPVQAQQQQGGADAAPMQVPSQVTAQTAAGHTTGPNVAASQAAAGQAAAAQTAAMLAGATAVINPQPQAHTMAPVLNQSAAPATSDAATAARDAQLAPAGHTLAGFLRRDQRGQQGVLQRSVNRLMALMPGRRKKILQGSEPEVTSTQWLFWLLTIIAYGALGTAVMFLLPSGSGLVTPTGAPSPGGYALALGIVAALTSLIIGRKLFRR